MAEFQEIVREFHRLCETQRRLHGNACNECPIKIATRGTIFQCYRYVLEKPKEAENIIMSWAAEHPEPVYPTWAEWLVEIGVAERVPIGVPYPIEMADGSMFGPEYETVVAQNERIPPNIVQKLGIKPKEG